MGSEWIVATIMLVLEAHFLTAFIIYMRRTQKRHIRKMAAFEISFKEARKKADWDYEKLKALMEVSRR